MANDTAKPRLESKDFIREIVEQHLQRGVYDGKVVTRFPPEPNGYLHIGHAKSIALNFGIANEYGGVCHLRFDDTNPTTEDVEYVESIKETIRWLGYDWGEHLYFASDYFDQLYDFAERLIEGGHAYVDSLSEEEIREYRGTVTEAGRNSPYRDRPVAENRDLFRRMRAGEFADGTHVLRAKIDMSAANMLMRDPILYRIRHAHHYRTGESWCIYPLYDFAHPLSDAIERITHSICTLEFENNRAVYDWLIDHLIPDPGPRQYEFARLNLDYTVMSKRIFLQLVGEGLVEGWDDPRMPTLVGLRRRGITPTAIRAFVEMVGVAKVNSRVEYELFEHVIRDDLNYRAPRVMCVLDPLKIILTNYPEKQVEWLKADYWPRDIDRSGARQVPFARELYVERADFSENPPPGYKRLSPGAEVRLRHGYVIRCDTVEKDENGDVIALHCTYDPETLGTKPKGRKVKGTIHWVAARHALPVQVRLYDRLFTKANPMDLDEGESFKDYLNPQSLQIMRHARIEPSVADDPADQRYQFERQGYFIRDRQLSQPHRLVFNRIVALRDSWSKEGDNGQSPSAQRQEGDLELAVVVGTASEERRKARAADPQLEKAYHHFQQEHGLMEQDADLLTGDLATLAFFEEAVAHHHQPQSIANWMNNALQGILGDDPITALAFSPCDFADLVRLVDDGSLTRNLGKEVLAEMAASGQAPESIVADRGLRQIKDSAALTAVVVQVLKENPDKVQAYRSGKTGLMGFFMGQVMRATDGQANPQVVQELLRSQLG